MTRIDLPYVRVVNPARGGTYYYFDTGQKNAAGKRIYVRLPDPSDAKFGGTYATLKGHRTRHEKAKQTPTWMTFPDLVRLYEKSPQFRKLSAASQRSYSHYLGAVAARRDFAVAPAADITRADVQYIADDLAERPGAANVTIKVIRAMYAWARKRGHVETNPAADVDGFESVPHEPWPEALLTAALADESVRLPVAMLYYTAQRVSDVAAARWTDIEGGVFKLRQQKTGKVLEIPLHRDLVAILAQTPRRQMTILTNDAGTRPTDRGRLHELLTGFARGRGFKVVQHGLRKNAVIALLEAGCSTAETAAISGQSLQMVEHYARARDQKKLGQAAILRWERK